MRKPILVMVFVLAASACAWAQEPVRFEVYGGYSYTSADFRTSSGIGIGPGITSNGLPAGWDASFTYFPLDELGLTAEFGSHYGSEDKGPPIGSVDQTIQTYMFGPRLMERGQRVEGFINILAGLWRGVIDTQAGQLTDAKIAVSIGGGVDLVFGRIGVRLFEADVVFCQLATSNPTFRVNAGVSYRW